MEFAFGKEFMGSDNKGDLAVLDPGGDIDDNFWVDPAGGVHPNDEDDDYDPAAMYE